MKVTKIFFATIVLIFLSACSTTMKGPPDILDTNGPLVDQKSEGYAKDFLLAQKAAAGAEFTTSEPQMAGRFLNAGFMLVYSNCSQFFSSAGENQKWIAVARDTVATAGTLAAGIVALHTGGRAAANLALGTGAIYGALDIYTKNFLFAAENVSSVRELIVNALDTHATMVATTAPFSYVSASHAIFDHQEICTPIKITALVREAIKKGQVTADPNSKQTNPNIVAANEKAATDIKADNEVLQKLGDIVNKNSPVTIEQAGNLWWWFIAGADKDAKVKIYDKLTGLSDNPFDKDGNLLSSWNKTSEVRTQLNNLTPGTKSSFAAHIASLTPPLVVDATNKESKPKDGIAPTQSQSAPVTSSDKPSKPSGFALGAPPLLVKSTRFTVGIVDR